MVGERGVLNKGANTGMLLMVILQWLVISASSCRRGAKKGKGGGGELVDGVAGNGGGGAGSVGGRVGEWRGRRTVRRGAALSTRPIGMAHGAIARRRFADS